MAIFSKVCTGTAGAATALVLVGSAWAQGASGSGTPPVASHGGAAGPVAGRQPGAGHDAAARSRPFRAKREGDLGRAPFGTGDRRHNAAQAGAPAAPPSGSANGTAGTR